MRAQISRWFIVLTALLTLWLTPAAAGDGCDCFWEFDAKDNIRGCSALIESGKLENDKLAIAFFRRGNAHYRFSRDLADFSEHALKRALSEHALDRALDDLNKAIDIKPNYAGAYNIRAFVYDKLGDVDRAIADSKKIDEADLGEEYFYSIEGSSSLRWHIPECISRESNRYTYDGFTYFNMDEGMNLYRERAWRPYFRLPDVK
jgi:tetratricopeptide (TPR) repeat protein